MAMPPIPPVPDGNGNSLMLDKARSVAVVVLLALLALCVAFSWTTRDAMAHLPFLNQEKEASGVAGNQKNLVDLRPWQTAEALAPLAVTAEETDYARQAEHLADHEVDQAFASALRQANLKVQHTTFTGEALALSQKVEQLKLLVAEDQAQVQRLTSSLSSSGAQAKAGKEPNVDNDDLEIAKAQLGLDSDELADAQHDLDRASGDDRAQIQGELAAHEASMTKYDSESNRTGEVAAITAARYGTLAGRVTSWFTQRSRFQLIQQALQEVQSDLHSLTGEPNTLEAQANTNAAAAGTAAEIGRASRRERG